MKGPGGKGQGKPGRGKGKGKGKGKDKTKCKVSGAAHGRPVARLGGAGIYWNGIGGHEIGLGFRNLEENGFRTKKLRVLNPIRPPAPFSALLWCAGGPSWDARSLEHGAIVAAEHPSVPASI